jgi:hypothetical protein
MDGWMDGGFFFFFFDKIKSWYRAYLEERAYLYIGI